MMDIETSHQNNITILAVNGRIDDAGARQLRSALKQLYAEGYYRVILDLSTVPYINTQGLATLAESLVHNRDAGGDLLLAGFNSRLERILEMVGFLQFCEHFATVEMAIESYSDAGRIHYVPHSDY
jgi:anti-sigma B factor antagonist